MTSCCLKNILLGISLINLNFYLKFEEAFNWLIYATQKAFPSTYETSRIFHEPRNGKIYN